MILYAVDHPFDFEKYESQEIKDDFFRIIDNGSGTIGTICLTLVKGDDGRYRYHMSLTSKNQSFLFCSTIMAVRVLGSDIAFFGSNDSKVFNLIWNPLTSTNKDDGVFNAEDIRNRFINNKNRSMFHNRHGNKNESNIHKNKIERPNLEGHGKNQPTAK